MSETLKPESNGTSRKALLAGASGAVAALAAGALARPEQARAGTDGDVVLADRNIAAATTTIETTDVPALELFASDDLALHTQGMIASANSPTRMAIWAYQQDTSGGAPAILAQSRGSTAAIIAQVDRITVDQAANGNGVEGHADNGAGLRGISASGNGVEGVTSGVGAAALSGDNQGGGYGAVGSTTSAAQSGVWGNNYGSGAGVKATSSSGDGVFGQGRNGVHGVGIGGTGGFFTSTGSDGVFGQGAATGVHGFCQGANGAGVLGVASSGAGVKGSTSFAATIGVIAENTGGGTGLKVTGRATFNRSGIATIAGTTGSPKNSVVVTVPGATLSGASMVLATIQGNPAGVYVQGVVKGTTSFTIFLNKAVTTSVKVGWFIIN